MNETRKNIKLVPQLRFSEFTEDWRISIIEDLFDFKNGLNKEKEFFGRGTPIINFMDVYKLNSILKENIKGLVELTASEKERFSAKKGDVFFTRTSETIEDIGMSATLIEDIENCVFSGFVLRARPKKKAFIPLFTSYLFSISSIRKEITTKSSMTTRALTSGTLLNKVGFTYPTNHKEQQKIASFLSSVDTKLNLLQQKKDRLEQYKKGVMQQIFSLQLRFKDNDGNEFPKWEEKKLKNVSVFLDEKRKPIKSSERSKMKGKYPYYGASGIIDYVNDFIFDDELILLGEDGENIISRNLPLAFRVSGKCWVNNHAHVIKPNNDTNIDFLTYSLERINYVKYNTGTAQPKLNKQVCGNIPLMIPSIEEQIKIATFLSAIDNKIALVATQIENTQQFKKGLLQQMFV